MDIVELVASLDDAMDLHASRLLVLLNSFAGVEGDEKIEGLTKLAKLDFLLRYPVMLQRALEAKGKPIREVDVQEHELHSVESEMVRYRFGPWDHRYREVLNVLVGKNLVDIKNHGKTIIISPTVLGRQIATELLEDPIFELYEKRAALLKRHFDIRATNLMKFIYETFPEIISLRANKAITL